MRATAGGDVDDGVGLRANFRQEREKKFRILRRLAILRVTGMQMQDRRTGFGCRDRLISDLLGRDRQVLGPAGGMDGAGYGAGTDDFFLRSTASSAGNGWVSSC